MLTRLLYAVTLAGVLALPAVAGDHHGGSGIVGPTRIGDLEMDVSTEADVRAFAGEPDIVEVSSSYTWITRLGYHCGRRGNCRTEYEIDHDEDTLFGFATDSKRFRTRRGTRVGQTRKRAERNERRKGDYKLCGEGPGSIVRERDDHVLFIFFTRRRVSELVVDGTYLNC